MAEHDKEAQQLAAQRELERLRHEGDAIGGLFARWFMPRIVDRDDPVEVWGTRIGRSLSVAALVIVCLYLVWIYLR